MGASVRDHEAIDVAARFITAIVWGEHLIVWELLSGSGRDTVLEAGGRRGMDPIQVQRIRLGTSSTEEMDTFLTGLLHGLRVDFSSVQLDSVVPRAEVVALADDSVEVGLECPASFGDGSWAAGSLILSTDGGRWLIDRVKPLVSRSE